MVAERTEPGTSSATEYRGLIQALLPRGKAWILRPEGLAYRFVTGLAAELEGFPWIGIEKEAEYVAIAEARLNGTQRGLGLAG